MVLFYNNFFTINDVKTFRSMARRIALQVEDDVRIAVVGNHLYARTSDAERQRGREGRHHIVCVRHIQHDLVLSHGQAAQRRHGFHVVGA